MHLSFIKFIEWGIRDPAHARGMGRVFQPQHAAEPVPVRSVRVEREAEAGAKFISIPTAAWPRDPACARRDAGTQVFKRLRGGIPCELALGNLFHLALDVWRLRLEAGEAPRFTSIAVASPRALFAIAAQWRRQRRDLLGYSRVLWARGEGLGAVRGSAIPRLTRRGGANCAASPRRIALDSAA